MLSCLRYADNILFFSNNNADCCGASGQAGFAVVLDKVQWSSSIDLVEEVLHVLAQGTKWDRSLELVGSVIEPGAHSGSAVLLQ